MGNVLTPYQTGKILTAAIESDKLPKPNLFQSMFGMVDSVETNTVNFDVQFGANNVASMFVSPKADAPQVTLQGYGHKELAFSYMKEGLAGADFDEISQRGFGQEMHGQVNVMQNYLDNLIKKTAVAEASFKNRFELTGRDLVVYGRYSSQSELHPEIIYDYGRTVITDDAGYMSGLVPEIDLSTLDGNGGVGKRAWDSTGGTAAPTPVKDFVKAASTCKRKSKIRMCVMSEDVFTAFQEDLKTNYKDSFDLTKRTSDSVTIRITPEITNVHDLNYRMSYPGANGIDVDIYTYDAIIHDRKTGVAEKVMPDGYMLMIPSPEFGYKVYGRILNLKAGFQAMPRFINSWVDPKSGQIESELHTNFVMGIPNADAFVSWKVML